MVPALPAPAPSAASISDVIARLQAIDAALPAADGVACFNRMYLGVTQGVGQQVAQAFYADPAFVEHLDVVFANLYFEAIDAMGQPRDKWPVAWRPLLESRSTPGIEPIQYALAGMNAHINHDLALAVVQACGELGTAPGDGSHHADYQKVDQLLDASEQAVRQSFEPKDVAAADRHVQAVLNLVCNWNINAAREGAWNTALGLWEVRNFKIASHLLTDALAHTVAMASRGLLLAV
ncbi:hypothetical protein SAMN05892883_1446 [Jatrophihabitans sp. GAS493]|uniref:DUF5995 family protein n=1 Tax=Jatrophihabitans sp. GAS493 TaxID=1907575 RepID=UPI000BB82BB6|nr:DUF5995 family protein [Jatrophihabitans sp. GAS493]SOD71993.1 hypothetical protein SAMN05892883_1446 [Jatrophihabitans sp. GAS493]